MGPFKSLIPDEFRACFYQRHWVIVGEDVCTAVLKILNGKGMPSNLNSTFIALIPKKSKPEYVTEFRLISLCNVLYKLVSNIIILTPELIHSMKNFEREKVGKMAMKSDISKTYDHVG